MTFRDRDLLDLAHIMPCQAQFAHFCIQHTPVDPPAEYAVEAAHSDQLRHGRGKDFKTPDWKIAALCHTAHTHLDTLTREDKADEWDRAHDATLDYMFIHKLIGVLK